MNEARVGFLPVDQYLELPRDRSTWLLKPLIPISGSALLYGAEKTGKSFLGIQLAGAISRGDPEWLGFPIMKPGKVLYLQLDTPRSVWAWRFEEIIKKGGVKFTNDLLLADRESLDRYPFDILQPGHMLYLRDLIQAQAPVVTIIDTLRMVHSGDEDSSTVSRNVLAQLVGATHPSALIIISHSRKPNPDVDKNIMADHRGSSNITASMDAIIRLTKTRLFYAGRSIEEGDIKLERQDNGLWIPKDDPLEIAALAKVLADNTLPTMRSKARVLSLLISKGEETCMSRITRATAREHPVMLAKEKNEVIT